MPAHYLVKSEPFKYSFAQLQQDGHTTWDGVRNFEARNTLRQMKKGDLLLYYHSNEDKAVVGLARVREEAFIDPTSERGEDWAAVGVEPLVPLRTPVTLAAIKAEPRLAHLRMLHNPRLSVVPVTPDQFQVILDLGETRLPKTRNKRSA